MHQETANAASIHDQFPRPGEVRVQFMANPVVRVGQSTAEIHDHPRDVARPAGAKVPVLLVGEGFGPGAVQPVVMDPEHLGIASAADEIQSPQVPV
jgi:hypothetical protein